jgi:hypothetical protein
LAELNTEALPSLDVSIPNQNALASTSYSANWHESLEKGKVLDQMSSVWRAPENYGSLLSAITLMECAVREKQVKVHIYCLLLLLLHVNVFSHFEYCHLLTLHTRANILYICIHI